MRRETGREREQVLDAPLVEEGIELARLVEALPLAAVLEPGSARASSRSAKHSKYRARATYSITVGVRSTLNLWHRSGEMGTHAYIRVSRRQVDREHDQQATRTIACRAVDCADSKTEPATRDTELAPHRAERATVHAIRVATTFTASISIRQHRAAATAGVRACNLQCNDPCALADGVGERLRRERDDIATQDASCPRSQSWARELAREHLHLVGELHVAAADGERSTDSRAACVCDTYSLTVGSLVIFWSSHMPAHEHRQLGTW